MEYTCAGSFTLITFNKGSDIPIIISEKLMNKNKNKNKNKNTMTMVNLYLILLSLFIHCVDCMFSIFN